MLYGVHPHNPKEAVEQDIGMLDKFLPPNGRLMLAFIDKNACGIGCLKSINKEIGEIKRIYVDPSFRQIGAGRAILQSLLNAAKETSCWLRLLKDTDSLSSAEYNSLNNDLEEILKILWAILRKTRMKKMSNEQ
jgi:GNAT superfamily N-acetyltransferase